jgi:Kdo2-lipid IVA lauroyltransferase/acyltransferase
MAKQAPTPPPLAWLFVSDNRRQLALRYWLRDTAQGWLNTAVHESLKVMPIDACSAFGAMMAATGPLRYPQSDARARRNWRIIRPEQADQASVDAAMRNLWLSVSRTMAEFSVLHRLWPAGRIAVEGFEHLMAVRDADRPILVACLHLGNWETVPVTGIALGFMGSGIYEPPENRFDHRIAVRARERFGSVLFTGPEAMRASLRELKTRKGPFVIFVDECIGDHVFAPAFGRSLPPEGNIAYTARLARMTGAAVIPAFCVRLGDRAQFKVIIRPPVEIDRSDDKEQDLLTNLGRINAVIEPIIKQHLDQWYFLLDLDLP